MKNIMKNPVIAALTAALLLSGCSASAPVPAASEPEVSEPAASEPAASEPSEEVADTESSAEAESTDVEASEQSTENAASPGNLPAYEYPGPELFYYDLYKYLIDEFGPDYPDEGICIPCPVIIAEEDDDRNDMKEYGNFWVFKYVRNGDVLECTSGGSYPGVIHVKNTDEGYEITGMDIVADGSDFTDSAKKIFGKHYDEFMKTGEDEEERERLRAQIIANYVFANDLDIKAYKDYGWDPVTLPEQNIDNFYSELL
ncbi:MAG: hypothetical protein K6F73_01280 [Lachnospiraceae bacterium]|nr:hypothetical protein [Lachnospiraceae bacterium]